MSQDRLIGEWSDRYRGPRLFRCGICGAEYGHDGAYQHFRIGCATRTPLRHDTVHPVEV
jgi:hypothetical protein